MEDEIKLYWHDLESLGLTKGQLSLIRDYKKLKGFSSVDDLVKYALLEVVVKTPNTINETDKLHDVVHLISLALRYPDQTKTLVTAALEVLQS